MVFGQVGFHGFWRRGLATDPPKLGFGTRDPCPFAGAIESGGGGLGTSGWVSGLDSPKLYAHMTFEYNTMSLWDL